MSSVRLRSRSFTRRLVVLAGTSLMLASLFGCGASTSVKTSARSTVIPHPTATVPTHIELPATPATLACGATLTAGPRDALGVALPGVLFPETASAGGNQAHTHYYSSACAADIARFFQTQLPIDGWSIELVQHQADQQFTERFHQAATTLDILIVGYPDGSGCYVVVQEQ